MNPYHAYPGRLWPSDEQTLLLRAALADGEAAVAAFQHWRRSIDLEAAFARPVMRLLPLVCANLLRLGVDDPLMGRLKGVYRLAWCENQRLFHTMQPVLAHLRNGGVELLLLKGVPLALSYYPSVGLRPMADLDLAVRPEHLDRALALLAEIGWRGAFKPSPSREDLRYRHAWLGRNGAGDELDVHYHLLRDCLNPAADHWFWSAVEPVDLMGIDALQLEPTALLFHTLLHGVRWNEETPIRWIPDVLTIVRKRGADLDWDRLLDFAATQHLTRRVALGLSYLAQHFGLVLPEPVATRVRDGGRPRLRERIENTAVLGDYSRWYQNPLGKQWMIFADYCGYDKTSGPLDFAVGFSHYLRYRWELRGRSEILPTILTGLRRRLPGAERSSC